MEYNNGELMRATPEWMKENYDRFNQELFGGELGDCRFEIFTTGRGSQGGWLGKFHIEAPFGFKLKANRTTGKMFIFNSWSNTRRDIDRSNFVDYCNPVISLNGHYSGTEKSLQETLVHEMCHYYDYMFGICPKQAHGVNFRRISAMVSSRSNGMFTVQRLASAEVMSGYQLDKEMQDKRDKRIANKKVRAFVIFVFKKDGDVQMTITSRSNIDVFKRIVNHYRDGYGYGKAKSIVTSEDPELIEMLFNIGYKRLMRTWRFWHVGDKPWINTLDNYDINEEFVFESMKRNNNIISEGKIGKIIEGAIKEFINKIVNDDNSVEIDGIDLGAHSPLEFE